MAQLVARMHGEHEAVGSSPTSPTREGKKIMVFHRPLDRFDWEPLQRLGFSLAPFGNAAYSMPIQFINFIFTTLWQR